jgi:hypothetical protein
MIMNHRPWSPDSSSSAISKRFENSRRYSELKLHRRRPWHRRKIYRRHRWHRDTVPLIAFVTATQHVKGFYSLLEG